MKNGKSTLLVWFGVAAPSIIGTLRLLSVLIGIHGATSSDRLGLMADSAAAGLWFAVSIFVSRILAEEIDKKP